jgi:small subunit ribosomal protein S16
MPVKLRLARHGRNKFAFYHIVAADGRAPRDGKFIEKLGIYNPNTNPATIELDFDKSLNWLEKGAQPTETVRAILSYKGVLMRRHLLTGVRKGAFSEEEAERKFAAWLKEKEAKIQAKKDGLDQAMAEDIKRRLEAETKISEARAAEISKKRDKLAEEMETEASEVGEEPVAEAAEAVDATVEEPVAEEPAAAAEAIAQEPTEEEQPEEEPVAEESAAKAEAADQERPEEEPPAEEPLAGEQAAEAATVEEEKTQEQQTAKTENQEADAPKDSGEKGEGKSAK